MTPHQFLELLERQGDAVVAHEERVKTAAAAPMRSAFSQLVKDIAKRWALLSDAVESGDTRALHVFTALFGSLRDAVPDLRPAARDSVQLGVEQAIEAADDTDDVELDDDKEYIPADVQKLLHDLKDAVQDKLDKAEKYLLSLGKPNKHEVDTAVAIAGRSVNTVEITASQVAVRGVAEGQRAVAKHLWRRMIWRAERDACLICLAYSGVVSAPDGTYPPNLTFGKPRKTKRIGRVKPPEHPRCRCTSTIYTPRNDPGGLIAKSLQQEARRSVVKGWGLPSESDAARRRAALNLLRHGTDLPKTVEAEARRRLRKGRRFRRPVPL